MIVRCAGGGRKWRDGGMLAGMDGRDGMRAADSDRAAVADRLRVALDEGRLDLHEYDERLQRAYAARTYADLEALLTDLPPVTPAQRSGLAPVAGSTLSPLGDQLDPAPSRGVTARWMAEVWFPYLRVIAIVVTIWAVTSLLSQDLLYFWPGWVAGPWGAVLVVRTVSGLAAKEPQRQAVKRQRRRERKQAKRALRTDDQPPAS
ncbi:uncharacterized protein GAR05_05460 [Micromonospora saelicesensis]|uniref:DUF1707 domain-containing protein n=2 Tax=Micromonospora saelicesensis TaxID=285676 RepID=A0ABX9CCK5_9ACTN|nr:uncharacterized protein GAR05_05460 [Micromonospora saelicesensis]RAO57682.1 uncharacterized protein LUPAC06_02901 [Micromonospora saelicesensis]